MPTSVPISMRYEVMPDESFKIYVSGCGFGLADKQLGYPRLTLTFPDGEVHTGFIGLVSNDGTWCLDEGYAPSRQTGTYKVTVSQEKNNGHVEFYGEAELTIS